MFFYLTPAQVPPESSGICGRLTSDLPLGYLQSGALARIHRRSATAHYIQHTGLNQPEYNRHPLLLKLTEVPLLLRDVPPSISISVVSGLLYSVQQA